MMRFTQHLHLIPSVLVQPGQGVSVDAVYLCLWQVRHAESQAIRRCVLSHHVYITPTQVVEYTYVID